MRRRYRSRNRSHAASGLPSCNSATQSSTAGLEGVRPDIAVDDRVSRVALRSPERDHLLTASAWLLAQEIAPRVAQQRLVVRPDGCIVIPGGALVRRVETVISQRGPQVGEDDVCPTIGWIVHLGHHRIAELFQAERGDVGADPDDKVIAFVEQREILYQ